MAASAVNLTSPPAPTQLGGLDWWRLGPLLLGVATLFLPTYWRLGTTLWQGEDHIHGPIVLAVSAWLIWKRLPTLVPKQPAGVSAWVLLLLGLLFYIFGRSQEILLFEVGAQIPILLSGFALTYGWASVSRLAFPIFYLFFMVPLPGLVVDGLTAPLKVLVSQIAESLLYLAGYPIARQGVILHMGPYQLLVADACSGLNSIFSLFALGLFYLYLMQHKHFGRNAVLLTAVVPIAITANVIRVIALILITYYYGDDAGQGFMHGFAGMTLFLAGLLLLLGLDGVLGFFVDRRKVKQHAR